jgi:DNA-binding LacI/PurR family transcriptional regulator
MNPEPRLDIKIVSDHNWKRLQKTKATLREIAEEAGVNVSTASRALTGAYGVRKETREKVLAAAQRLGYRPNLMARGLVTGRSQTIGVLVSDIRNPYFAEIARGAEDAAFAASFDVILCNSDLNPDKQIRYVRSLLEKNVAGILMNSVSALTAEQCEELTNCGIPVALLNKPKGKHAFSTVLGDNYHGGRQAGEYLIGMGHRNMAHLTGHRGHGNFADRCRGFLDAAEQVADLARPVLMRGDHNYRGGYEMAGKLFAQHPEVTAIFAANDVIAYGVVQAAAEAGKQIPQDISLIGFDNLEFSALIHPPLTTIHQPKYEIGQAAVEILLRQVRANNPRFPEQQVFGVTLVERQSCCKRFPNRPESRAGNRASRGEAGGMVRDGVPAAR